MSRSDGRGRIFAAPTKTLRIHAYGMRKAILGKARNLPAFQRCAPLSPERGGSGGQPKLLTFALKNTAILCKIAPPKALSLNVEEVSSQRRKGAILRLANDCYTHTLTAYV